MQCTKLEPGEALPTVPTTTKDGNVFYSLFEVHVMMNLEAPLAAESRNWDRGSVARWTGISQLAASCIELAGRIRPDRSTF